MARYTEESRQRVREATDMADLVGQYTELRRSGAGRITGRCPFHEERTPSLSVDVDRQLFHCFGCEAGGDLFDFVAQREGLDFPAALEFLARRAGIELEREDDSPEAAARRRSRTRQLEALQRAAVFYARHLTRPASPQARDAVEYLRGRGLLEPVCARFQIGYAPPGHETLRAASHRAGFSDEELQGAGLLRLARGGQTPIDRFSDRLMFPVGDQQGRIVGFGARKTVGGRGPKYVNSPASALYRKSQLLYGSHHARAHARRAGAVVAEGNTDVLALRQAGLAPVVAAMGTALTERQLKELARLTKRLWLCFDGDAAGEAATLRGMELAVAQGFSIHVAALPPGQDPADLVASEGADALRQLTDASRSLARFHVERELQRADLSSAEGKDALIDAVRGVFAWLPSSVLREDLIATIARRLEVDARLVAAWLTTETTAADGTDSPLRSRPSPAVDHAPGAARELLLGCLSDPSTASDVLDDRQIAALPTDLHRRAARHIREHRADPTAALPADDHELVAFIAALLAAAPSPAPARLGHESI
ncbi:MAG: DNA primase [Actinobacteria bacterium]|nr:DNA primase [Actinomycetota bacterium]